MNKENDNIILAGVVLAGRLVLSLYYYYYYYCCYYYCHYYYYYYYYVYYYYYYYYPPDMAEQGAARLAGARAWMRPGQVVGT